MNDEDDLTPKVEKEQDEIAGGAQSEPIDPIDLVDVKEPVKSRGKRQAVQPNQQVDIEDFVEIRDLTPVTKADDTDLFLIDDALASTNSISFKDLFKKMRDRIFKSDNEEDKLYLENVIKSSISETLRENDAFINRIYEKVVGKLTSDDAVEKEIFEEGFEELSGAQKQTHAKKVLKNLEKKVLNTHNVYNERIVPSARHYHMVARDGAGDDDFAQYELPARVMAEPSKDHTAIFEIKSHDFKPNDAQYDLSRQGDDTWWPVAGKYYMKKYEMRQLVGMGKVFAMGHLEIASGYTAVNLCIAIAIKPPTNDNERYFYLDWHYTTRFNNTNAKPTGAYSYMIILYNSNALNFDTQKNEILAGLIAKRNVSLLYLRTISKTTGVDVIRTPLLQGWYKVKMSASGMPTLLKV